MRIEIRITGPCATGKSVVAHAIARALRGMGFINIMFENVDHRGPRDLHVSQMDAEVLIREGRGGQPIRDPVEFSEADLHFIATGGFK